MEKLNPLAEAARLALATNIELSPVNDHCIRLAVNEDRTYPWHRHPDSDELFLVLEGILAVEFSESGPVELHPGDTLLVPAGTIHRTIARGRTVNLCFEAREASTEFIQA